MSNRFPCLKPLASGAAALVALGAVLSPGLAAAQTAPPPAPPAQGGGSYDAQGHYYPDCRTDATNRGVAGAVIGGILGAVLGSQVAAGGHRVGGTLIGGGVGAVAGGAIGSGTSRCNDPGGPPPQRESDYDGRGYDAPPQPGGEYEYRDYQGPPPADEAGPPPGRYDDRDAMGPTPDQRPDANGCTLAPSPIYMPDGSVQQRMVRVCRDPTGHYQVVE